MSIGAGIAIVGPWLFAAACALSRDITAAGVALSLFVAVVVTLFVVIFA